MADGSTARQRALDFLAAARNPDGSWGYLANGPGAFEPTLLAAASGAGTPVEWLSRADLSWGELLLPAALSRVPEAAPLPSCSSCPSWCTPNPRGATAENLAQDVRLVPTEVDNVASNRRFSKKPPPRESFFGSIAVSGSEFWFRFVFPEPTAVCW